MDMGFFSFALILILVHLLRIFAEIQYETLGTTVQCIHSIRYDTAAWDDAISNNSSKM